MVLHAHAPDAAVLLVHDAHLIPEMAHLLVAPVADVEAAIRSVRDHHGPEPFVRARYGTANVLRAKRGAVRDHFGTNDVVMQHVAAPQFAAPCLGERVAFVDNEL